MMVFKEPKASFDSFLCIFCKSPSLIMMDSASSVFLVYLRSDHRGTHLSHKSKQIQAT